MLLSNAIEITIYLQNGMSYYLSSKARYDKWTRSEAINKVKNLNANCVRKIDETQTCFFASFNYNLFKQYNWINVMLYNIWYVAPTIHTAIQHSVYANIKPNPVRTRTIFNCWVILYAFTSVCVMFCHIFQKTKLRYK